VITFNPIASTILRWFEVQSSEVDALPAPFSIDEQCVGGSLALLGFHAYITFHL
jgi:hypothetical protein